MARSIEIDEDVLAVLLANVREFGETENDVLRRLLLPSGAVDERVPRQRRRAAAPQGESVRALMAEGRVKAGDFLACDHGGRRLRAVVLEDGSLRLANDENAYPTPGSALRAVFGRDVDAPWRHVATQRTLSELQELQSA